MSILPFITGDWTMNAANKKLHWSARPENAVRAAAWKKAVGNAQKGKKKGPRKQATIEFKKKEVIPTEPSFAERLTGLMEEMNRRIEEIDKAIGKLQDERNDVLQVFKTLKQD